MGSRTHCSKIDGFLGTHGTHANGATAVFGAWGPKVMLMTIYTLN